MLGSKKKKKEENHKKFLKAINGRKTAIVHLTHNDLDAAGCDAIHRLKYGEIFTIWSSISRFEENLEILAKMPGRGDTISISDIGYHKKSPGLLKLAKKNEWKIEWRDHHRWNDSEKEEISKLTDYIKIDTETCAAGIVARDLMPGDEHSKEIARVVCDYDLWKHEDPRSKILGEVGSKWKNLDPIRDCFFSGKLINKEIEEIYDEISKERNDAINKSIEKTKIYEGRYKIAFAPMFGYPSETAHAIRDCKDTDIEVIVSDGGKFSIRSKPPVSHLIAREFGGGGHPPAAGGKFEYSIIDKISILLFGRNRHFKELFLVAEKIPGESSDNHK
ncbi:MAG: phosphoesterase [Methanomicrobiaceae archaeon]|nr:phosphoesterase [Methanomicrobiaceae archaeon]